MGIGIGSSHPSDIYAQVINIFPDREENSNRIFYFDVEYATNSLQTNDPEAEAANPLIIPSSRSFSTQTVNRVVSNSPITGAPFVTTSGVPTPIEWPFVEFVMTITRNEAIGTISHYSYYHETIDNAGGNNTGLMGAYPGEILLTIRTGQQKYAKAIGAYVEVSYDLRAMPRILVNSVFTESDDACPLYNANGSLHSFDPITPNSTAAWEAEPVTARVSAYDKLFMQAAYEYWAVTDEGPPIVWQKLRFRNANGDEATEPELLNIWGGRLLSQDARFGDAGEPTDPVYKAMQGYRRTNFADLNLLGT